MTVCGTGNWTGPKPGDPDSNVLLSATSVFGGVKVSWTMPQLFPYAVAHIRIYRAIIQDYASSIEIATVNASSFIDINEDGLEKHYYYWITIVSVNGTDSPLIGPASALSRPHIDGMIELLTGKIEQGALSIALKGEIDNISLLGTSITDEVAARMAANAALGLTITGLDGQLVNAMTVLDSEVNERITADSAIVTSLDLMAVGFNSSVAGLAEEIILQTGPTSALSQKITTLEATVDGDTVTGQIGLTAEVDTVTNTVAGLYTAKIDVNGLVGGFGLSNNGAEVEAGFDVDRFWVGRSAVDPVTGLVTQVKPFIIEGTEVFINDAVINKLTFSKLTDELGGVIVENGIIRADLLDLDWDQVTGIYKPANGATRNVYKGLWTSGTPYLLGDNVIYDGNSWECIFSHASDALNHPPIYPITSNAQWNIVAIRGQGQVKGVAFVRGASAVAPTGGSFFSPNPTTVGWSDGIPADDNTPLWMSTRLFTSDAEAPQQSVWSTPAKIGTPSTGSKTQFSVDGSTSWHDEPAVADVYMRAGTSTDNGVTWTYAGAVKIKGENGSPGLPGDPGAPGAPGSPGVPGLIDTTSRYVLDGSGGLVGGNLTWDPATGARTAGSGVALTGKGIVGHNGTKSTFVVNGTTGDATFGGALDAASGSFAGSLSAATGSFSGSLSAATGSFAGSLSGASGTFSGTLTANAINAVNTINIGENAVTIPSGTFTAASIGGITGGAGVDVQTLTFTSSGGPCFITGSISYTGDANNASCNLRLYRNGQLLTTQRTSSASGLGGAVALAFKDVPGAGSVTYVLNATASGIAQALNRSLMCIEVKK